MYYTAILSVQVLKMNVLFFFKDEKIADNKVTQCELYAYVFDNRMD